MIIRFYTEENKISSEGLKEIGKRTNEKLIAEIKISKELMKKKFVRYMKTGEMYFLTNEVYNDEN